MNSDPSHSCHMAVNQLHLYQIAVCILNKVRMDFCVHTAPKISACGHCGQVTGARRFQSKGKKNLICNISSIQWNGCEALTKEEVEEFTSADCA